MLVRIRRLLLWLKDRWSALRRARVRRADDPRANDDEAAPNWTDPSITKSEIDMTEKQDTGGNPAVPPAAGAADDQDIEAVFQSMQGELDDLSGMLAQDGATANPTNPQSVATRRAPREPAPSAPAGSADEFVDAAEATGSAAELSDAAAVAEVQRAVSADSELEAPGDLIAQESDRITKVEAQVEPARAPDPAPAEPAARIAERFDRVPRAATESADVANAARQAFGESTPRPAPRPSRGPRGARRAALGPVESAILGLAGFLEDEVNVLWEDARSALTDIVAYRDQMQQTVRRFESLEREMHNMRDEIALARRETHNLQQQAQNLRDDAARARQRADQAALDAQSAADRAVSAAREIETAASVCRTC